MFKRWWAFPTLILFSIGLFAAILIFLAAILIYPNLPSLEALTDYRPKIPLRIYTEDDVLIGEFGEERRVFAKIDKVPEIMKQAILAAEDDRFYQHGGVDYQGVARAALSNLTSGGAREGASTITMQVARNFFLSREKTLSRKFSEVMLALKIEHNLSKDQILELYINQIYLGQRAYGFATAAQVYFGKPLEKLNVAETSMLAGLPKAPSRYNPVVNPKRAKLRQQYVLRRMHDLHYIDDKQYEEAMAFALAVRKDMPAYEINADYVSEMVRQMMYEKYKEAAYTSGFKVYTTLRKSDQDAAQHAVIKGVLDYDRRHGYRGPEAFIQLQSDENGLEEFLEEALQDMAGSNGIIPAVVLTSSAKLVKAYVKGGEIVEISGDRLSFAQRFLDAKSQQKNKIQRGSLVRVVKDSKGFWQITQLPQVEAAFVSMNPQDGAIRSLVGGFDFERNKYNHVMQAMRQPGSSFKPFIYSAALEKGFTAATIINDAPIVIDPADTGGKLWEPKNYEGDYSGPLRFRTALTKSKNLVSIRILQAIGIPYTLDYITRFGLDASKQPPYLTMALGAGSVTPFQMASAYSVFANGGYRVPPYYVTRILDARGNVLALAKPTLAGQDAQQAIDPRNAFIMTTIMQDVVKRGTAARAMQLGRQDLAGKTGTTNDQVDAWFTGYQPGNLVAIAWVGFDQPRTLGGRETGAQAALPMWIDYMGKVLKGVPESVMNVPEGVVVAKINPQTGLREMDGGDGIAEYFYQENLPGESGSGMGDMQGGVKPSDEVRDQLF
ncbi:penicillin-binding protein 1A [Sulfurirhabdus autotrophica]|uniref:Penicillin-binding protein 1A n=1 Tax=Sulfurirhabdus autotrophica TaxID=1706046 RepID=A0A4R3XXP0_9PROT|nr:penicillin-binding protein 1A [Sulfurirhabdus autotrophica]TCV82403.1 penicillin-binding protein 1A [Sulfurirhabdus autotrophica]